MCIRDRAHIILLTDVSRLHGLGFALMQKLDNSGKLSLIMCGSKSNSGMDNARLLRISEKLAKYNFDAHWAPGKTNIVADALNRAPIFDPKEEKLTTSSTLQCLTATWE